MSTLFFVDVETTGLYPVEKNRILEIGIIAVSEPDFTEIEAWSTPIFYEAGEIGPRMNDFVLTMHQENGLLADIGKMQRGEVPKVLPRQALLEALAFVNRHTANCGTDDRGKPEVFLCGANPQFDRDYISSWMPDLAKRFHHRVFDVNTLFLLRRFLLGGPHAKFGTAHRVLADCRQALAGVHEFVQSFAAAVGEVQNQRIAELEACIMRGEGEP
jgi:oligoribonuclease (3'-5' exoribonuclease)